VPPELAVEVAVAEIDVPGVVPPQAVHERLGAPARPPFPVALVDPNEPPEKPKKDRRFNEKNRS
jgi:hypothetical protein